MINVKAIKAINKSIKKWSSLTLSKKKNKMIAYYEEFLHLETYSSQEEKQEIIKRLESCRTLEGNELEKFLDQENESIMNNLKIHFYNC